MLPSTCFCLYMVALAAIVTTSTGLDGSDENTVTNGVIHTSGHATHAHRRPAHLAEEVFAYWIRRAGPNLQQLPCIEQGTNYTQHLDTALRRHGLSSTHHYCIYAVTYSGAAKQFQLHPPSTATCNDPSLQAATTLRARETVAFLNYIARIKPLPAANDFAFVLDVTDGTWSLTVEPLFQSLQLPVLSQAVTPDNRHTIAFPDVYLIAGLARDHGIDHTPIEMRYFEEDMRQRFNLSAPVVPWKDKKSMAVYRASCFPTSGVRPGTVVLPRAQLCQHLHGSPSLVDIGLSGEPGDDNAQDLVSVGLRMCRPCRLMRQLTPSDMRGYKFQLIADGYGYSADGTFWKLTSGGIPIWILSDANISLPLWQQWYTPQLRPFQHYIPATPKDVPAILQWCLSSATDTCRLIAQRARATTLALVNGPVAIDYAHKVLSHVQQMQAPCSMPSLVPSTHK